MVVSGTKMKPIAKPLKMFGTTTEAMPISILMWPSIQVDAPSTAKPKAISRRPSMYRTKMPARTMEAIAPRPRGLTDIPLWSAE